MLHIHLVTLFPEFYDSPLSVGLLARARENGIVSFDFHNPRAFSEDRHHHVDDSPYGGGVGMVMQVGPLARCLSSIEEKGRLLFLTPVGERLSQEKIADYARESHLTILCGRYEGIDERVGSLFPLEPISLTDAVLNSGDSAALCLIEAVSRLQKGFMGKESSGYEESFTKSLLEYPHYTRPDVFGDHSVPEVLLSGNHKRIEEWRHQKRLERTLRYREDLLEKALLTGEDLSLIREIPHERVGRNLSFCLVHHPVRIEGKSGTSALTNLDIHDIARISASYGLGNFYVVTPLHDQKMLLHSILEHWIAGRAAQTHPDRAEALRKVSVFDSLDEVIEDLATKTGMRPLVCASSARTKRKREFASCAQIREQLEARSVLILLGTAQGLADEAIAKCDTVLRPLRFMGYNHLSVRSAAAIIADRILKDFG